MSATVAMSDTHVAAFQSVRPRLFGIACRVLGSPTDADDVVQDAWMRWSGADRSEVRDATGFLVAATTRLAINVVQSARARREISVDTWYSEPIDAEADPARCAEQAEALDRAVLTLIEKLSPTERAAYVLREALGYPYRHISQVLGVSEPNARQIVTRARGRLADATSPRSDDAAYRLAA